MWQATFFWGGLVEKKLGIRCIEQSVSSPYQWWDVVTQGKAPIPQPSYVTQGRHSWLSSYRRYELLYNHISTVLYYSYDPLFYHKYSIYLPAELLEAHIPMLLCSFPQRFVGYPCTVSRLSLKIWYQNEAFWDPVSGQIHGSVIQQAGCESRNSVAGFSWLMGKNPNLCHRSQQSSQFKKRTICNNKTGCCFQVLFMFHHIWDDPKQLIFRGIEHQQPDHV